MMTRSETIISCIGALGRVKEGFAKTVKLAVGEALVFSYDLVSAGVS